MNNSMDKHRVRLHFDRHAREYDQYAKVQAVMAETLTRMVARRCGAPSGVRRILEIGCGTGVLTERMLRTFPCATIVALDLSPAMLAAASCRLGAHSERVTFVEADAEHWAADRDRSRFGFDLIVSSATFQWFNDPGGTVRELTGLLARDGLLAFATFGPDTFRELHAAFARAESELGLALRRRGQLFPDMTAWQSMLERSNGGPESVGPFSAFELEECRHIECYRDVRDFLRHVQRMGASSASTSADYMSRALFGRMQLHYVEQFGDGRGVCATYHLLFAIAICAPIDL